MPEHPACDRRKEERVSQVSARPNGTIARASAKVHRVLIVDDHPMLRRGLTELISHEPHLGVCGEAYDLASTLEQVKATKPDLLIIDIALKDTNGIEVVKQIKAQHPTLRMLVCSMHDEMLFAERSLRAGAMGYISKERALEDVIVAIRTVLSDKIFLSERMSDHLLHRVQGGDSKLGQSPIDRLTDRELEVFELIGNGQSTNEIATRLSLSPKTVDAHRQKIKRRLDIATTNELTQYAVKWVLEQTQGIK